MKQIYILAHDTARKRAIQAVQDAPEGYKVTIAEPTRTLDQNALLWPLLTEISKQVDWYGQKLTQEEWKDVFSSALKGQKAVPGMNGGFVILGQRTSQMSKQDFSDLLDLIQAFGAEKGVEWND